jgi:uncharacterized iron-regulated membrane protein
VLYVIFFAGSFSFFRDEIIGWERNEGTTTDKAIHLDYDKALKAIDSAYDLKGRSFSFYRSHAERRVTVNLEPTKDSSASKKARESQYIYLDTKTHKISTYENSYSLGEFLYRLHFLAQIPYPYGYYIAGFTALFFLFAIITGVLVHWKKIVSNFYVFRPKEKLKTMWTDAHTSLGMIGLPFQFVYAVTGAFFLINIFLVAPAVLALYGGDEDKLYDDLGYGDKKYEYAKQPLEKAFSINDFAAATTAKWKSFEVNELSVQNYGDKNMQVIVEGAIPTSQKFHGTGTVVYKVAENKAIVEQRPTDTTTYLEGTQSVLYRIHFADYGGYALKLVSFVLGLVTCFVIISGVMIWLTARDKKNMPEKKRRFNERVARIYLATSLSMYPMTALSFIAVKIFRPNTDTFFNYFYFLGWLLLSVAFILKKDNFFTNKTCLMAGSIIGFFIPVTNGVMTGNWPWNSFENSFQVFFIDVFWLLLASITFYASLRVKRKIVH